MGDEGSREFRKSHVHVGRG